VRPFAIAVALLSLALTSAVSAHAAPPEGCAGFPDIPEAYVCITRFTPENAVPTAGTSSGTTFTVPAFCAFAQCVGPTPVTVPGAYAAQGEGAVAEIHYNGSTHTVPVAQVPAMSFSGTLHHPCLGCGPMPATFDGVFTGVVKGHSYANATMSASGTANDVSGAVCPFSGAAEMTVTISDSTQSDTAALNVSVIGATIVVTFRGGFSATGVGARIVVSPLGNPCLGPAEIFLSAVGQTLA